MFYYNLFTLLLFLVVYFMSTNAQPDVRKKSNYNPAMSDGRVNTEEKKTFIKGKVLDKLSNEPIIGATVKLIPKGNIAYTDLNGYFEFLGLSPDTFEIEVNYVGYKKTKFTDISTIKKQIVNLVLPIEIQVSEVEGVVIVSEIPKFSELAAILLQKNSSFIADIQSGNQLEKENYDYSIATGFQRMNGASFVANRSYVRGLPERYNPILLNNAPLLSLNPQQSFYSLQEVPINLISSLKLIKSSTSEYYANYGGGIMLLQTEEMPEATKLKLQFNGFYNTLTTFKKRYAFPPNHQFLFLQETQNIKIKFSNNLQQPQLSSIPNYSKVNSSIALPSTQWNAYFANRFNALNNRDLGIITAISFIDNYQKNSVTGTEISHFQYHTLFTQPIKNASFDKHTQNVTAIANASLKWSTKSFLHSKNMIIYKTENQVFSQPTDSNWYHSQSFQRNFTFAQQNSGQHNLVAKKDRSLRMEWTQFYHYYYQQTPAQVSLFFQHSPIHQLFLNLPNANTNLNQKLYQQNLIYANKQQTHQVGGDLFFDIMFKEEERKAKTRLGSFVNFTSSQFNNRNFHYYLNNNFSDPTRLSYSHIITHGLLYPSNENFLDFHEVIDSASMFQAQNFNLAPYINVQYELTEIFHFVFGFRIDLAFRTLSNLQIASNPIQIATQSDLPSLSLIFRTNEKRQFRFNYMMSTSRPTDKDILGSRYFHPLTQILQLPNPSLLASTINHFDVRYEIFPNINDAFSANLFFKEIHLPIENVYSIPNTPQAVLTSSASNSNAAIIGGAEFEWKQNMGNLIDSYFLEKFLLYLNGYFAFSNTKPQNQFQFFDSNTRPLQGHSNYGFNLGFNWAYEDLGLKVMTFLNHKGKSIFLAHSQPQWNIWELQRTDWSFQISKSYQANWEFRIAIFNLLNQPLRWVYLNKNHYFKNDIFQTFRQQKLGRQFLISVNYRI